MKWVAVVGVVVLVVLLIVLLKSSDEPDRPETPDPEEGGGLILDGAIGIPDEAKPENVKAMAETVREYGGYN